MKTLLLTTMITLTSTFTAQASYMSNVCSNANSTIISKSGHRMPSVIVNDYSETATGGIPVELDTQMIKVYHSAEKVVFSKQTNGCQEEGGFAYGSSKTISTSKITISNKDGSTFPEGFTGRSIDGLTIEDYVICESFISSQVHCEQN